MKKSSKIIVILLVLILIAILGLGGYVIYDLNNRVEEQANTINELEGSVAQSASEEVANINENESNTVNSISANSVITNSTVEDVADTETVEMSIEDKICSVIYLEDFDDGENLTTNEYLVAVSCGLDGGYISSSGEDFSVSEINKIVYTLFNTELKENKSYSLLEYNNGKYELTRADGDAVPVIKNMEQEKDGEELIVRFDLYTESVIDDEPQFEATYEVVFKLNSKTGNYYVQSKNLVE